MNTNQAPYDGGPIPGPPPSPRPDYPWEPSRDAPSRPIDTFCRFMADLVREPIHWIHENIVEKNRGPKYYWYHKKFEKALPVDECYIDDWACVHEANIEYRRGFLVDVATLELLRWRKDNCNYWFSTTRDVEYASEYCEDITDTLKKEELNFHIKYGDLSHKSTVLQAYTKQKHRMIIERRIALRKQAQDVKEAVENQQ